MYMSAVGQSISGALKIILNRLRPGMDGVKREKLPHRHWLPGSPAYIALFGEPAISCPDATRCNSTHRRSAPAIGIHCLTHPLIS